MDIKQSKSILAKLLAAEDITIVHKKAPTASFAPKERILTLPVWKDMSGNLYDLLVGHEVGHALYTPAQGWHDAIKATESKAFAGFLNIVEDARIEKLVRRKFPGLRSSFYAAYQDLLERDFFNLSTKNIDDMLLIDRLNLHFKVGSQLQVEFKGSELVWIERMHALETWEDVRQLALELFEYCKDELEQKQDQAESLEAQYQLSEEQGEEADGDPQDMDLDQEQDAPPEGMGPQELIQQDPIAETDEAFRESENKLLDPSSRHFANYYFGRYDASLRIVPYRKVMNQMIFNAAQADIRAQTVREFKEKNGRYINFLVQQFELKRNAQQQARAKISKSGELDMKKVFNYRISEDLFRRFTSLPNGKNHGMIMMFDMSGSMRNSIGPTIEQMLILVQFCRKVGVAFEVYGFTNFEADYKETEILVEREGRTLKENQLAINDQFFRLRQYFSDEMSSTEFKQQMSNLIMVKAAWDKGTDRSYHSAVEGDLRAIPRTERLNGTPLNDAIMLLPEIHNTFKARTKSEITSLVILTDGESDDTLKYSTSSQYYSTGWALRSMQNPASENVVITDLTTKKSVRVADHDRRGTQTLLKLVQEITGARAIGFHIVPNPGKGDIRGALFKYREYGSYEDDLDQRRSEMRKTGVIVSHDQGYAEHYLIKGGRDLAVVDNELEVEEDASTKEIGRAFLKLQGNKLNSRVLLSKFVAQIA